MRRRLGLPYGREAPEAGERENACFPTECAEPAQGAAADGQHPNNGGQMIQFYI